MRRVDTIIGIASMLFAGLVLTQSLALEFFQRSKIPGPGFLPTILAVVIAVLGAALVVSRMRGADADFGAFTHPTRREVGRSVVVWLAFFIAILSLEHVGFVIASAVLIGFLLLGVERLRSTGAILTVVMVPLIAYVVFVVLLGVTLPTGPWGF